MRLTTAEKKTLARLMGWTLCQNALTGIWGYTLDGKRHEYFPDWAHDLNAVHDLEGGLNVAQLANMEEELRFIQGLRFPFRATASQRVAAILATLPKDE